jgi:predicted DNA-binding ribbon-helix-helix protein
MSELLRRRSVTIAGHRTSVSLEDPFWDQLKAISSDRNVSIANVVAEVDKGRQSNLSSALRVFVLKELLKSNTKQQSGA